MTPEETIGPYWVSGELIRFDLTDGETGIPLHLEIEFLDKESCDPVNDTLIDIWCTNATGVYSGVSATGQGGVKTTFNRGVQPVDENGIASFDLIMPGHYAGRATHIHVATHSGATQLANNTYSGGTVKHIGQLYFDERLRSAVEAMTPYSSNQQDVVSNEDDGLVAEQAQNHYDPFVDYVFLGRSIQDGILAWISIGLDAKANHNDDAIPAGKYPGPGTTSSSATLSGLISATTSGTAATHSASSGSSSLRRWWLASWRNRLREL